MMAAPPASLTRHAAPARVAPIGSRVPRLLHGALPRTLLAAALCVAATLPVGAAPKDDATHRFAAIGHLAGDEAALKKALTASSESSLEFVVANGIKGANEPCSDKVYQRRRQLLEDSARPLILSLAASDWTECRNSAGRSNAIERLNRLRELFFADPNSLGERKLQLTRLSSTAKFRSYAENAHWKVDDVLYATVNIPSNNNHYLRAAGRNSEYEDRLVANRAWLHRLFTIAKRENMKAVVLFTEADVARAPDAKPAPDDGFAEVRRQLDTAAKKYPGKVLLVDADKLAIGTQPTIKWRANIGHLSLGGDAVEVTVDPAAHEMFTVRDPQAKRK